MRARNITALTVMAAIAMAGHVHAQGETPVTATQATAKSAATKSGYVKANGVDYYYEIHGKGEPLLLLHGGLGSIDMFGPVLPMLAARPPGDRRRSARPRPHRARRPRRSA